MSVEIFADVKDDGTLSNFKRLEAHQAIKSFAGKRISIKIERAYNRRTIPENKFYWAVIIEEEIQCFKEFWGESYTKQQIHEWNKSMFWADEKLVGEEVIKTPCSSTKYTTTQWEERIELIRQWFWDKFEYRLSFPNEQKEIEL